MFEDLVERHLPDKWELVEDDDEQSLVASNDAGDELYIWEEDDEIVINLSQVLESDGYQVDVTTHAPRFEDTQTAKQYVVDLLTDIESGEALVVAFAIVGHDGSPPVLSNEEPLIDPDDAPPLADVFVCYPSNLPEKTSIDDVLDVRRDLVNAVYGDPESIDSLRVLESKTEAYAGMTAEVFSVSEHALTNCRTTDGESN